MKFDSKKGILTSILILGFNTSLIGITIARIANGDMKGEEFWALIPMAAVVGLLFWIYFGTSYELSKENGLVYKSGPVKGKIKLERITEIIKGKSPIVGFRPATSRKGLIVKFDKYNDIYISPKTNESFIEKILELKGEIKISE